MSPGRRAAGEGAAFTMIQDSVDVSEDPHAQHDTLRAFLTDQLSSAELRSALESEPGYRPELHAQLASQLGLAGWTIPEEFGGLGKSQVEACAIHVALGPALSARRWYVVAPPAADILVIPAVTESGLAMFLAETGSPSLRTSRQLDLDLTRRISILTFEATPAVLLTKDAGPALARAEREFLIGTAAEAAGGIGWWLEASLAYIREQGQSERPAGSFEAVASFCVEMLADLENVSAAARYAAAATDVSAADAQKAAHAAALQAGECYRRAAEAAIGMVGDIGFTQERDAQLYYRRAWSAERLSGGPQAHRDALAAQLSQSGPASRARPVGSSCNRSVAMCDRSFRGAVPMRSVHWLRTIMVLTIGVILAAGSPASASGGTTIGPVQINPVGHPHLCWQGTRYGLPILLETCDHAVEAQQWSLTPDGVLMNAIGYCLEAGSGRAGGPLYIDFVDECGGGAVQVWRYNGTTGHLSSRSTCAGLSGPVSAGVSVVSRACPAGPRWSIGYSAVTVEPGTGSGAVGGAFAASVTVANAPSAQTAYKVSVKFGLLHGLYDTAVHATSGVSAWRCDRSTITCTGTLPAGATGRIVLSGRLPASAKPGRYTLTTRAVVGGTSQRPGTPDQAVPVMVAVHAPPPAHVRPGHSLGLILLAVVAGLFLLGEALLIVFVRRRRPVRPGVTP